MKTEEKKNTFGSKLKNFLSDKIADTWKLLSETDYFLSRTEIYCHYENQMRELRAKLNSAGKNTGKDRIVKEVHAELTELRKELRLAGYDISLGKYRLVFDGFRHDDSLGKGFKRMVLFICDGFFLWLTGEANHIELAEVLEEQVTRHASATGKSIRITGKHYLWYLRTQNELVLSGADTETKQDYEQLQAYGEAASLLFLSRLKNLN